MKISFCSLGLSAPGTLGIVVPELELLLHDKMDTTNNNIVKYFIIVNKGRQNSQANLWLNSEVNALKVKYDKLKRVYNCCYLMVNILISSDQTLLSAKAGIEVS